MKLNWGTLIHRPAGDINDFLYYDHAKLAGCLALYTFNGREAEVSAMTHPDYRRQGVFKHLLAAARSELQQRRIPEFLFICEQASTSGRLCMQAIGAGYDFSEYKMDLQQAVTVATFKPELQLRPATPADLTELVELNGTCFNMPLDATQQNYLAECLTDPNRKVWLATIGDKTIGKIQISATAAETYISGFCLWPEYRGRGYGTVILAQTVAYLLTAGYKAIVLEVATDNQNALTLYERCGFKVTTAYDYYRLPV